MNDLETTAPVRTDKYVIVKAISYIALEHEVKEYMDNGWTPLGAPFIGGFGSVQCIHQAFTK